MKLLSKVDCSDLKEVVYLLKDGRTLRIKSYICDEEPVLEIRLNGKEIGAMKVGEEL